MANNFVAGTSTTYNYTGKCQKVTLPRGTYRIDCYGGKGGGNTGASGDKTTGYYTVTKDTDVYLWIGQAATSKTGGWNGGGTVTETDVYGGGGRTDVSLKGTDGSTSWNNTTHLNSILISAAGGQGQGKTGGATTGTCTSTRIDARTEFVNRQGVYAAYIIPKKSGTLYYRSNGYNYDPYGFVDDANGKQLAANDDSGRTGSHFGSPPWNGEHHYWDWLIQMSVSAGVKYQLRVGSFATSLGAGITGWAKWYATFPESEVEIYKVITSGGAGGGSNYFNSSMFDTSTTQYANSGNGYVVITRMKVNYNISVTKNKGIASVSSSTGAFSVLEGTSVTLTATVSPGYIFKNWTGDFSGTSTSLKFTMPEKNVSITVNATPKTNTPYKVVHHLMNLDGTYTVKETANLVGTTDTTISPEVNSYTGFISPNIQNATINGDGSTVINYYYARKQYEVILNKGTGIKSVSGNGKHYYEANVTINAVLQPGYSWQQWTGDYSSNSQQFTFTMSMTDIEMTAIAIPNTDTKYTI
jgi:uncharacterized repeat protein (TIGR02543 family)